MARIHIYDTTLRDGSQGEGVNFSLQDKLLITRRLDELGVDFIEGGYPLSNPKDFEYFQEVRKLPLRHARIAAFGMTRRKGVRAAEDTCIRALLDAQTPLVTLVGKTWDLHVREVLNTTLESRWIWSPPRLAAFFAVARRSRGSASGLSAAVAGLNGMTVRRSSPGLGATGWRSRYDFRFTAGSFSGSTLEGTC